ncbi:putative transcription factor bHLH family [Medicago truncatula]|uniref:Basic helix loop helix (BHLH) DNA-binding family protein n=2 Tax=Medicago truncatula TaxID=3880 RepID=G8A1V6_MEDTR|nr:transcription factor bHLH91 isoform X2 [Medicago truncatula]KEH31430.1 basic helix loop helix (BHLH) DNA-binding family protein [Medicago truncatula]RHN62933.1 putative transcription factor bHLH family [Medicago truncatula]
MSSGSGDKQNMHEQNGCFDPNTKDEGVENSPNDNNTNNNNSLEENFKPSVEELPYHNHQNSQHLDDVSTYTNGFTPSSVDIEQLQNLGLNIGNTYNNMDNHLVQEVYQNSTWDPSVQDMDYVNHQEHRQLSEQQYQQFIEAQNHNQSYNPSTILDPHYPSPDVLNLLNLPRCSSSLLTNSSTICMTNPTQNPPNFHNSMTFLGDLPIGSSDNTSGSSVLYDPLYPLNLPPQPPALRELFQSLPRGYSMPTNSRNGSLFGGGDEMEGDGDMGVLEFNRVTASVGKGRGGKATKHFATEKQRREQLNGKYKILRDLIPSPTKTDRASVVGDAIEYIRELIRTVNELKLLVEKKRHGREMCKRLKTEDDAAESCNIKPFGDPDGSIRTSWLQRKSKDSEVDVRIIDDDVTIKLFQRKKVNCLLFVSKVLDELQLELHHVAGGHVGEYCSFLFNSKVNEGSSVYASAIANRVIDVMDTQYAAGLPHISRL